MAKIVPGMDKLLKERIVLMKRTMRAKVVCKDGFSMSVQDGPYNYADKNSSEVGFPSEKEALLMKWCEDPSYPTETVYGYVPNTVIEKVITKHGGRKQKGGN